MEYDERMLRRVLITPTTFEILEFQRNQNLYIEPSVIPKAKLLKDHAKIVESIGSPYVYTINVNFTKLPDIVFVANGGFSLWGLPESVCILPQMKYKQRKDELPYLEDIFNDQGLITFPFPSNEPFEGQAEAKWFHDGSLLVCGYGHRSTKESFEVLDKLLQDIYSSYNVKPPTLLVLPLESPNYYHLDVAMLEFGDNSCIVHKRAFSEESIEKLKSVVDVHIIDTKDSFCLNAVVHDGKLLTHILNDRDKTYLEKTTGLEVVQHDTSIFEKSGGSVRCMILDIY
jgi:N-dimethylarginine dimethylaminohydrolase